MNAEDLVKGIIEHIEPDQKGNFREGLRRTPKRVVESWKELYSGYGQDPKAALSSTFNGEGYDGIVLLKDIEFYSTCEHHMLNFTGKAPIAYIPVHHLLGLIIHWLVLLKDIEFYSTCEHHMLAFTGKAHVAYIPTDRIVGISKLARIVEVYARRLQNQERITTQVADALEKHLKPLGAAVIIEASHACMGCRGVKKSHAIMSTSAMRGVFFDKAEARAELMQLIKE